MRFAIPDLRLSAVKNWLVYGFVRVESQDRMLDAFSKKHNLRDIDWRPQMYKEMEERQ